MKLSGFLASFAAVASALHVYIGENSAPSCLIIDLGKDALLSEKHSAWEKEAGTDKWIRDDKLMVEITIDELFDKNHRVFEMKTNPFSESQFIAVDGGEHKVCFRALSDGWWSKNKVKLDVDFTVSEGRDVTDFNSDRRLGYFADRASEVARKFVHINREQRLMRDREASLRDTSEQANSRVAYMTVLQIIVLGATCAWQVSHLKSFFVKQKLV